jgi:hypothetical protein
MVIFAYLVVPWTDLANKPTVVEIEDIFIHVGVVGTGPKVIV